MDYCPACNDKQHHCRLRELMSEAMNDEIERAKMEYTRLACVFKDVCWYNFETQCRNWRQPWPQSIQQSPIKLLGMRIEQHVRNGHAHEVGTFPVYYRGTVGNAPPLPPAIVLIEMKNAFDYMRKLERAQQDVFDWAPGSAKYQQLAAHTLVGKEFSHRSVFDNGVDGGAERDAHGGGYADKLGTRRLRQSGRNRIRIKL